MTDERYEAAVQAALAKHGMKPTDAAVDAFTLTVAYDVAESALASLSSGLSDADRDWLGERDQNVPHVGASNEDWTRLRSMLDARLARASITSGLSESDRARMAIIRSYVAEEPREVHRRDLGLCLRLLDAALARADALERHIETIYEAHKVVVSGGHWARHLSDPIYAARAAITARLAGEK